MNFSGTDYSKCTVEELLDMHNEYRKAYEIYDVCDIAAELHKRLEAATQELETIKNQQ